MLRPLLIVGVGGSGGKTIRAMKETLLRRLQERGWPKDMPLPQAWQFLQIDTAYDGQDFPSPMLPHDEVALVVDPNATFASILKQLEKLGATNKDQAELLAGWGIESYPGNVGRGAGMIRGVGRQVGIADAGTILKALQISVGKMEAAGVAELMHVATVLEKDPSASVAAEPEVFLITSLSGGSGAGMFIDVAEILKRAFSSKSWVQHIKSLLYTAEVFEGLPAAGAVNQNSLGAMNEIVAGFYRGPSESTNLLMKKLAMPDVSAVTHDHVGPRINVLIGARNGRGINISQAERGAGQNEVFLTIGETLGNIVLDPKMSEYFYNKALVNVAVRSSVKDESGLSGSDPNLVMPFFSVGFGRLSLGADRVTDYVTDALTYDQIRILRYPDLEPPNSERTSIEVIAANISEIWDEGFLRKLGLDEKGEHSNDVTDVFKPNDLDSLALAFASEVLKPLSESDKAQALSVVAKRTWAAWESCKEDSLQRLKAQVNLAARGWVTEIQKTVMDGVAVSISSNGLQITAGLLQKVITEVNEVHTLDLPREVKKARDSVNIVEPSWWFGKITDKAEGKQGISTQDRAVVESLNRLLSLWFAKQEESIRKQLTIDLLQDLERNFLTPLHEVLVQNYRILAQNTDSSKPEDNEGLVMNEFPKWGNPVPPKYKPRAIEQTLIDSEFFQSFYLENAGNDLTETLKGDTWRISVREALLGRPLNNPEPVKRQELLQLSIFWSPKVALSSSDIPANAQFKLNIGLATQRKNNRVWLYQPGSAFARVHKLAIRDYVLTGDLVERRDRENDFVTKAGKMIQMSSPLTTLNQNAMNSLSILAVDSARVPNQTFQEGTKFPFGPSDAIFEPLKALLQKSGEDVSSPSFEMDWFDDSGKDTSLYAISVPEGALPAYAFASLTKPIAGSVRAAAVSPAIWNSYFAQRRTRPMQESIPMTERLLMSTITGWVIAKAFGLVEQKSGAAVGVELAIWNPTMPNGAEYSNFPSPLLEVSRNDARYKLHISSVLLSYGLAMVNFGETGDLSHTYAYRFLKYLGREVTTFKDVDEWDFTNGDQLPSRQISESKYLRDWIVDGVSEPFQTSGSEMGLASKRFESREERIKALVDYLDSQSQTLGKLWSDLSSQPWTNVPATWEIRAEIDEAIRMIRDYAEAQKVLPTLNNGVNL